ncbi:MAG: hypothetical protein OES47_08035 [Acidobacteriota bacterium]|nr:hypothetical protein [Acidobacteriota bacterium]
MLSSSGRARVREEANKARRVPLRRGEQLSEIVEEEKGWLVAGVANHGAVRDLIFLRGSKNGVHRLPRLAESSPGLRGRPRLLTERGHLAGVAWLEGSGLNDLAVKTSDWTGIHWGPADTVSWGPAIRSGLTSTVLADGSWLLVWSQHDGTDDELFWSLREGANWTSPAPVDNGNSYPDITPQLLAIGKGALLAWSRFDGQDYRLVTARFHRGRWRTSTSEGPAGSVYPSFKRTTEGPLLLFRNADPAAWTALRLDEKGEVTGMAQARTPLAARPVLKNSRSGETLFDWPLLKLKRQARWEQPAR